ncbi:hypothetical protein AGABI1DRAFT_130463 [Agaricus bisporus var. burnettii JB137-S8]|uniref:Uncharacterized protein n=1 Tax=Agaricus bisporus var. burnettii (strain JB137-S8 / ATCC MYA-4627 / FGSC 10392) TaxID=597362 RepID=K5XR92_AGABU|nr:uncharacterized protein AGABI1DRAFT_130463 [Agaricus bisporus var. burnettii JB137-S8]EKM77380.1 hypothetical protein AGABI1DRAFT_130463 [Agaricus bisporus var. burnettii JB137-S8]
MVYPRILILLTLAIFQWALACETECKDGVTNVFVGNYSSPVHQVFRKLGERLSDRLSLNEDPQYYLQPINDTFHKEAYDFIQNAIFSRFHGKCQDVTTGINPIGCPNPSCPVICGTPGSLVYHYPELEAIVHTAVKALLVQIAKPSSPAYSNSSSRIYQAYHSNNMVRSWLRFSPAHVPGTYGVSDRHTLNQSLSGVFRDIPSLLDNECGGPRKDAPHTFPRCSWKKTMTKYILRFP